MARGRRWSSGAKQTLRRMARQHATTSAIAKRLNRTKGAVRGQASRMDVSLKPKD